MRRIATLLAVAAAAVMLSAGSSAISPASAEAAACKWGMPSSARIVQGNNHTVDLTYNRATRAWKAKAYNRGKLLEDLVVHVRPRALRVTGGAKPSMVEGGRWAALRACQRGSDSRLTSS